MASMFHIELESQNEEDCTAAIDLVDSAKLTAIEHLHLKLVIVNAIDSTATARFILDQVSKISPGGSVEDTLRSIKNDLNTLALKFVRDVSISPEVDHALRRRQNNLCCVSGHADSLRATHIVSPAILDDPDVQPGGALRPLLEAIITAKITEELFMFLRSCNTKEEELKNLWLMSPSVRSAYLGGHIWARKLQFYEHEKPRWRVDKRRPGNFVVDGIRGQLTSITPSTPNTTRFPLPEFVPLRVHETISASLHYMSIEQEIQRGWPPAREDTQTLGRFGQFILRGVFRILPNFVRLGFYKLVLKAVVRRDPYCDPNFRVLPLGLCLKFGDRVSRNEANALRLVEKHTSIAAPRLIDITMDRQDNGYLLMTKVPGTPLEQVFHRMTYEERSELAKSLKEFISQYRLIPNYSRNAICDTLGGPTMDHRTETLKPCGPFDSKKEFLDFLTKRLEDSRNEPPLSYLYAKDHEVCFTHSDLHLSNIMVVSGQLSGIVDWENACFKPEYWEYTRAVWAYMSNKRMAELYSLAFDKSYQDELESERLIWRADPVY